MRIRSLSRRADELGSSTSAAFPSLDRCDSESHLRSDSSHPPIPGSIALPERADTTANNSPVFPAAIAPTVRTTTRSTPLRRWSQPLFDLPAPLSRHPARPLIFAYGCDVHPVLAFEPPWRAKITSAEIHARRKIDPDPWPLATTPPAPHPRALRWARPTVRRSEADARTRFDTLRPANPLDLRKNHP